MKKSNFLKKTWRLVVALLCVTTFAACDSDDDNKSGEPYFYIENDYANLTVTQSGYNLKTPYSFYTVRSNRNWEIVAVEDYDWCQTFPTTGEDDGVFRVIAKANDAIDVRVAYFRIIADGVEQPVMLTVTQDPNAPYVTVKVRDEEGSKVPADTIFVSGSEQTTYAFVTSNVDWGVSVDSSWFSADKTGDSVSISFPSNVGEDARYGVVSFYYLDNPNIKTDVVVRQEAGNYMKVPVINYTISKLTRTLSCAVDANIPWEATSNDSWITVTYDDTKAVLVVAENTTSAPRVGTVTLSSPIDPVRFNFTVTVNQDELGEITGFETPVAWQFTAADMAVYKTQFESSNALAANLSGTGYIGYISNCPPELVNASVARVVGGTGHPYVTGAWPGDWWLFEVPVTNLRPGVKVNIKYVSRVSGTGQLYWILECYDGGEWKAVGNTTTENVTGLGTITYSYALTTATTNTTVDATYTFTNAITSGNVSFRMRCVANWQANGSGPLAAPNGGTCRIAGAANGTSPVISLVE